jgi:hypothetical protein
MQRAPLLVVSGAVAGFAGLIGWHSVAAGAAGVPQAAATGPGAKSTPAAAAGSGSGSGSKQHARRGAGGKHAAAGGATGAGSGGGAGASTVRTATGPAENFGYGTIAVRVTVRGSRITAASVSTLTTLEPTSQQICAQAIPMLHSEVIAAHSSNINGISGATYTSQGYYQSLQAALAKLHVS